MTVMDRRGLFLLGTPYNTYNAYNMYNMYNMYNIGNKKNVYNVYNSARHKKGNWFSGF